MPTGATQQDNSAWGPALQSMASGFTPGSSALVTSAVNIDVYEGTSTDWASWIAPSSDYLPTDSFFGTDALNILILSNSWDQAAGIPNSDATTNFQLEAARIAAAMPLFSAYAVHVFIDSTAYSGWYASQGNPPDDSVQTLDQFVSAVSAACDLLNQSSTGSTTAFVYEGTLDSLGDVSAIQAIITKWLAPAS